MKHWFALPEEERRTIFNQVSAFEGLPAQAIEKDWWVTTALRLVFSSTFADHLVFKGGTSLSKGWNLIERFSEDIDLVLDRDFLGYSGPLSKNQVKELRKAACTFISDDLVNELNAQIEKFEIPHLTTNVQAFKDSDKDPVIIELHYPSLVNDAPYLQNRVLLEIGTRALVEPFEERPMQSMVDRQYPEGAFTYEPFSIPCVLPKRLFLEKAFLLHEEFQKPPDKIRSHRLSRHLYDIEKLMDTEHGQLALSDPDLYQSIVEHRAQFTPIKGVDYNTHQPDQIDFIPPESVRENWERDYQTMRESMIYGEAKSYETLIDRLKALRERFRRIGLS